MFPVRTLLSPFMTSSLDSHTRFVASPSTAPSQLLGKATRQKGVKSAHTKSHADRQAAKAQARANAVKAQQGKVLSSMQKGKGKFALPMPGHIAIAAAAPRVSIRRPVRTVSPLAPGWVQVNIGLQSSML